MIWKIIEGEIAWLPGINSLDIPQALPSGISVHLRTGTFGIESQGVVGAVPLNNGDTIHIIPKIGEINFLRLLFKAEGKHDSFESDFDEFVRYSVVDETNIDSIVARNFLVCLDEILRRSPIQGRRRKYKVGYYATGEIHAVKTAMNLATKKQQPVVSLIKEKIRDIPENRLLTEALIRAWPFLSSQAQMKYEGIHHLWLKRFPRSKKIFYDLFMIEHTFAVDGYGGSRDYYRRALMLAKIILGTSGIGFGSISDISGDAILLNAADVFEKYIRSVICEAYVKKGYIVTKGGVGLQSLYTDGSFQLVPDIVISRNGVTVLIADAKYKNPAAGDHYQMNAYLAAHKLQRGLLVAPQYTGNSIKFKEFSTPNKVVVREVYLPMNDLDATEKHLASLVEQYSN